nr:MAG TPA: hypothetical protein [Caudoviricetes sp.]
MRGFSCGGVSPQCSAIPTVIDIVTFKTFQKIAFPLGEGNRRQTVEGFCGIFFFMC